MQQASTPPRQEAGKVSNVAIWWRIMGYLRPYGTLAAVALFGLIGSSALAVLIPRLLRDVIDEGITASDNSFLALAALLIVGLGVLRGVTGFIFRYFGERLSHFIAYDMRNQLYDRVQNLPFSYHDKAQTGTLITVAISDVDEVQRYFAYGLIDGAYTLLLLVGAAALMLSASLPLTLVAFLPLIPLAFLSIKFVGEIDPRCAPSWSGCRNWAISCKRA